MGRVVSIVLVAWNSAPFLRRCLAGIRQQTHGEIELIAIDNASGDDSTAIIRSECPGARQIANSTNRGFTGAVNQGVAAASGELVLLLNPDAFMEPDYVARLVHALEVAGDTFGAATGKLMKAIGHDIQPTDLIDSKGIRMTRSGRHFDIGQGMPDGRDDRGLRALSLDDFLSEEASSDSGKRTTANRLYEVFGVSGAAAMYRMSLLRDVSIDGEVLDEDFHSYREDADLAWRGRLFGWRAIYVPDAVAYHVRSVTPQHRRNVSPVVNMHSVKNRFLLRLKNEALYLALRNAPFEVPRDIIAIIAVLTIERSSLPALSWLWKNRRRVFAKRREIQRRRRVSDRSLAAWFR
jgi:GT2 family glycosyltransferase